jgi:hypothetical protein
MTENLNEIVVGNVTGNDYGVSVNFSEKKELVKKISY